MQSADSQAPVPLCPSAQADWKQSVVIGVVSGTVDAPRVIPLPEPLPVTPDLLARVAPVTSGEVFRAAAPCLSAGCIHFKDKRCTLVERVIQALPEVTEELPNCRIRESCRWWRQEGSSACRRCPQVVTDSPFSV